MNTNVPPFDKKEVRQAVNYGVDSRALSRLFGGRLAPGCNFLPPGLQGHEELDPCPYGDPNEPGDLEKARQLIKDAGVEGESVDVYTNNDENRPEIGQYLTDMLNKIGLSAEAQGDRRRGLLPDRRQRQDEGRDRRRPTGSRTSRIRRTSCS